MAGKLSRREAGIAVMGGALAAGLGARVMAAETRANELRVELEPLYRLSPFLYMQFMEPLGTTDGSVEAAWDHEQDRWRPDVVEATKDLGPTMVRWGGIFTDFYRWREGVGPRDKRPAMMNLMWGGLESNQVGTAEFVDFCRQVGAKALMCVNFEGDGRRQYRDAKGSMRWGDAREAADWVAYCNDPDNAERRRHGMQEPLSIPYWQLGNETSYDDRGFDKRAAIEKMKEFAQAMREADPSIKLIGWADSGWAADVHDELGEQIDLLAFHHMFNPDRPRDRVLEGERYRRDPAATWECLMDAWKNHDAKIRQVRESLGGRKARLAMTECHFAIPGRDRCDVMSTWATGVAYARMLNLHQRHGDVLDIATAADFCGTRWQVNAVMIPVPRGKAYLMPVARVMRLYRRHTGDEAVRVAATPEGLDIVASRTGGKLFLHVANTRRDRAVQARLALPPGSRAAKATAYEIVEEPTTEVWEGNSSDVMQVRQRELAAAGSWEFTAASVTAVEVELADEARAS